ncbi:MAG: hypothetical protein ABR964_10995 [Tepidisphaeraceae bacterium]
MKSISHRWTVLVATVTAGFLTGAVRAAESPVTPFLNAQTNAVIYVDASAIDVDAISAWQQKLMATAAANQPDQQRQSQRAEQALNKAKQWIGDFKQAGGKDLYAVAQLNGLFMGQPGEIVVPLGPGANADALAKVFVPAEGAADQPPPDPNDPNAPPQRFRRPVGATAVIGSSLVYSTSTMVQGLKTAQPQPRQDLTDALAAGDAPIRIVFSPTSLKNTPFLRAMAMRGGAGGPPGAGGPGAPGAPHNAGAFQDPQWDNVTWGAVLITLPPNESAQTVFQCKDNDSANALATLLRQKIQDMKNDPQAQQTYGADLDKVTDAMAPVIDGAKVTVNIDQKTVDVMASRMASMRMNNLPGGRRNRPGAMPPGAPENPDNNGGM